MELSSKVALYLRKPEFRAWLDNPEKPRDWTGAARFLGLTCADADVKPVERLKEVRSAFQTAIDWCDAQKIPFLICERDFGNPIHVSEMANLLDFLYALTLRFPEMFRR